ncbi:MAG: hypothetical protein ACYCTW_10140 [Sulfuricella sp.]
MTSLGERFPADLRRAHVENALKPGSVIRLVVKLSTVTKPKFLVLVAMDDPEYLTFIINSEINPFISNRPHLSQCQVSIDAANHTFLDHDSHVACHETLPIRREDVIHALVADPSAIKGEISPDVRAQVVAAVKFAKTLDKDKKNRIIAALN